MKALRVTFWLCLMASFLLALAMGASANVNDLSTQCADSPYRMADPLSRLGPLPTDPSEAEIYRTLEVRAIYVIRSSTSPNCQIGEVCKGSNKGSQSVAGWLYATDDAKGSYLARYGDHLWYWHSRGYEMDAPMSELEAPLARSLLRIAIRCPQPAKKG